jgi:phosphate transport system permease protein
MKVDTSLTRIAKFFNKKKKENLLTGSFLLATAVILLAVGVTRFINGIGDLTFSIVTFNDYLSTALLSLLIMVPSLFLFSAAYLLWEGHSLGWKLSILTCGIALLIALTAPATIDITLSIAFLSGIAAALEILRRKNLDNQPKDSPVVTENVVKLGLRLSVVLSIGIVIGMVIYVVAMSTPFLSLQLFTSMNINYLNVQKICQGLHPPVGSAGGVLGYAIGTMLLVTFCEFVAVPIGIGAAIYLAEYSTQNKIVSTIRFFIETLAGSPSVVVAIIGFTIFVLTLRWGFSLWGAAISLSFMCLPWNIRVAEEAMKSVPRAYREASFALGASQWQTAHLVTLYAAMPGIITGILLGVGVAIGETLILLWTYTGSAVFGFPSPWWNTFNFHQPLPSLTVFIWQTPGALSIVGHPITGGSGANDVFYSWCMAFAAALVLITIYLVLCIGALLLRNYLNRRMMGS